MLKLEMSSFIFISASAVLSIGLPKAVLILLTIKRATGLGLILCSKESLYLSDRRQKLEFVDEQAQVKAADIEKLVFNPL